MSSEFLNNITIDNMSNETINKSDRERFREFVEIVLFILNYKDKTEEYSCFLNQIIAKYYKETMELPTEFVYKINGVELFYNYDDYIKILESINFIKIKKTFFYGDIIVTTKKLVTTEKSKIDYKYLEKLCEIGINERL